MEANGQRVHASARRRHDALHADDDARTAGRAGARDPSAAGLDPQILPRGGARLGQGGRANTATDPAGLDMFETTISLKPAGQWRKGVSFDALVVGDGLGSGNAGRHERVDDADQRAHRHARDRHSNTCGHQDLRTGPRGARAPRQADRTSRAEGPRHAERVRRARRVGILPGHRHRSRGGGPSRRERRRRAGRDRDRHRRHDRHADGRRAGTVRRASAVPAGTP